MIFGLGLACERNIYIGSLIVHYAKLSMSFMFHGIHSFVASGLFSLFIQVRINFSCLQNKDTGVLP